ncbi:hypothetical protein KCU62_g6887, partial [Aureobasidium sp. EXF-3399]
MMRRVIEMETSVTYRTMIGFSVYAAQNLTSNLIANQAVYLFEQAGISSQQASALGLVTSALLIVAVIFSWGLSSPKRTVEVFYSDFFGQLSTSAYKSPLGDNAKEWARCVNAEVANTNTDHACDACRKRKTKCDGTRPTCQPCSIRDVVCVYAAEPDAPPIIALKRKYEALKRQSSREHELLSRLRSASSHDVQRLLNSLRTAEEIDTVSQSALVSNGPDDDTPRALAENPREARDPADSDDVLSIPSSVNGASSSQRSGLESGDSSSALPSFGALLASVENRPNVISKQPNQELFEYLRSSDACHANNVFQRIRSGHDLENILSFIESGDLRKQLDLQPETRFRYELPYVKHMPPELVINNQYLDTLLHDTASLRLTDSESREARPSMSLPQIVYLRPFHAAHVIDPLIESAKPSLWTSVCQDDDIMRRLLRNHFLCEFNFMSALQKDLFLENMNGQHGEFCSSLLVNAVLAYACVCDLNIPNRAEYWNSTSLTYKFLVEAKRLWEIEALTPRISTVQAGIILNGISNLSGLDQIGQTYLKQTIALANRLGLFLDRPIKTSSEKSRQCMIYTAWALFCWDALVAFSIQQPPLLPGPPQEPLPSSSVNPACGLVIYLLVYNQEISCFQHNFNFTCIITS